MEIVKLSKYEKESPISYTFGIFPTFELVNNKDSQVLEIILSTKLVISEQVKKLLSLCEDKNIKTRYDDKTISKLSPKENCFIVGVFKKYNSARKIGQKNLVLVNPSDMGNIGTIMRTTLGFGITDLIIIKPAVDYFNPKVVRASMGAIFSLNIIEYDNVEEYLSQSKNKKYFFMLKGKKVLGQFENNQDNFDLIFGNEATGLPDYLLDVDESVVIKHSNKIDSLNLPISVGIALYQFTKNKM